MYIWSDVQCIEQCYVKEWLVFPAVIQLLYMHGFGEMLRTFILTLIKAIALFE
jgi:hypothetical protein